MNKLNELKNAILADGIIDEDEVKKLHEVLYEDGVIDREEAEFLFELNDAVSGKENHASWEALFVDAISSYLLDDPVSPGEVDEQESIWLANKLMGDGQLDDVERALLKNLASKVSQLPIALTNLMK